MRVYKVSAGNGSDFRGSGTTSNTSAIRGSVASTLDLLTLKMYIQQDKDFILV